MKPKAIDRSTARATADAVSAPVKTKAVYGAHGSTAGLAPSQVVRLVLDEGKSVGSVARDLSWS